MKEEARGIPITECIGCKMSSYILDNLKGIQKAKGVNKNVVKKEIKHEHYKFALFYNQQLKHTMKSIRSINQ